MLNFINYRMRVTIQDSRQLVGTFMAFDKHMNLVLGDCEEFRKVRGKKGEPQRVEKRTLGLILLRGETVVSMQIEAAPAQKKGRGVAGLGGPGTSRSMGRGLPSAPMHTAPAGLAHPMRGVGGAAGHMMQPQMMSGGPNTRDMSGQQNNDSNQQNGNTHGHPGGQGPPNMPPPPPHMMGGPPPDGSGMPPMPPPGHMVPPPPGSMGPPPPGSMGPPPPMMGRGMPPMHMMPPHMQGPPPPHMMPPHMQGPPPPGPPGSNYPFPPPPRG